MTRCMTDCNYASSFHSDESQGLRNTLMLGLDGLDFKEGEVCQLFILRNVPNLVRKKKEFLKLIIINYLFRTFFN